MFNRRRHWIAQALIVALALAACTPAAPTAAPAPAATDGRPQLADQQRLVIGSSSIVANMDPHFSIAIRRYDVFETLTMIGDDGNVELLLATSWKLVTPTSWQLTLRQDARFHDGTPVTVDDVVFSWNRINEPALKSPIPGNLPGVTAITALDRQTLQVTTRAPDPLLLKRLNFLAVVPKAYLERVGDATFAEKPIGSGPFKLKEFRTDDRVVVTAWPEHAYRKPTLTEVVIRNLPDLNSRAQGLRLGEVDFAQLISIEQAQTLEREGFKIDITNPQVAGLLMDSWGTNGTDAGPVGDKRVRQAIAYAIDRETLARGIYRGISQPIGVPIPPGTVGYNPDLTPYTFDLKRSKELLAAAGYANGFKVTLEFIPTTTEVNNTALFVQSQLKEVGIDVELAAIDQATFRDKIYKQKPIAPLYLGASGTAPLLDSDFIITWAWSENKAFGKRHNDQAFDRVYEASREEMDPAKREVLLKQAAAILQENPLRAPMVTTASYSAYNRTVGGLKVRAQSDPLFDTIYRTK